MYAKECKLPLRIMKYEAALSRISPTHPAYPTLQSEYNNWMAGYKGEKSLEFYLSMLSYSNFQIFHSIRLPLGKYYFQMDYLIICSAFALVLEVKNRVGEYFFKKHLNQTYIRNGDKEERIQNPVLQAKLQALKLKKWLAKNHCPEIPIYFLFVNSNKRASIQVEAGHEQILSNICNSENLIEKMDQIANVNKKEMLDTKNIRKVKRLILTNDTPETPDILEPLQLTTNDVVTGVQCPECHCCPMTYKHGTWICQPCGCRSKTAHIQAVRDYFLLIKPTITNSELRKFLHIKSPRSANRILRQLGLSSSGTLKSKVYYPKEEWLSFS